MLAPSLASGSTVENYRGKRVFLGLGIVWVFWVGGIVLLLIGIGVDASLNVLGEPIGAFMSAQAGIIQPVMIGFVLAGVMAIPAFVFGMIDDAYGGSAEKGFRGHVAALAKGRLTTGGLKMLGVGIAALFVGLVVSFETDGGGVHGLLSALTIALAANLLNLVDLRPLRSLKTYTALVVLVTLTIPLVWSEAWPDGVLAALVVAVTFLGPVGAVWSYDAREQGMLGDAGANPAGAVAGVLIALWWPTWAVGLAAAVLFALNVASEKVSFSAVIEGSTLLSRLDAVGRRHDASDA
jgi:hypothetical protein